MAMRKRGAAKTSPSFRTQNLSSNCRRFPGAASADLRGGPRRNFRVFTALDFLAEVTQHIPDKGEHLVGYYGWYSHRQHGLRAKSQSSAVSDSDLNVDEITIDRSAVSAQKSAADGPRAGSLSTWAMLIQRVYEVDPLACPHCGAAMKIVSFIECRQRDVIERILRHCGLWEGPLRTLASARGPPGRTPQVPDDDCTTKHTGIRQHTPPTPPEQVENEPEKSEKNGRKRQKTGQ